MADDLADRAGQLIADFEHAAQNNAPVTPVMMAQMKSLVEDALADKAATAGGAQAQAQHALKIANELRAEADELTFIAPSN